MAKLLSRLIEIILLRAGPQDLPAAWPLAVILSIAYMGHGFVSSQVLAEPEAGPAALLAIAIQFLVIAALLNLRGFSMRLPQTICAISGVGLILATLSVLLISQADPERNQPALALVWFGAFLWSLVVDAHIYRHALSIKISLGVLLAVLLFAANFLLNELLF
jgi:hypothetical protein